ncbi:class I SAM-dependent methyltransferase [Candidatus Kaiserbacteria bacterium]|nr:class I SAM-dependent methyltransferase [Candidatus Kaiserbacteria bacterium]
MMAKHVVQHFLRGAGIECNGPNPWDPQIHDERFYLRFMLKGSIGLGESYVERWWGCERLDMFFCKFLGSGLTDLMPRAGVWRIKLREALMGLRSKIYSRRGAESHYDLDRNFFFTFLGKHNNYTCLRWDGVSTVDDAEVQKMHLVCRKAQLQQGQRLLDIGCGWGGTLAYAAENFGVRGVGINVAEEQLAHARKTYGYLPVEFRRQDYHDLDEKFDRVISIGMIEHVGRRHYREYLEKVRDVLPPDGLFVLQGIVDLTRRATRDPWTDKYIWSGGMFVELGRLRRDAEGVLYILDEEYFGEDYDKTLMAWYENLRKNRAAIIAKYGLEEYRKYEYLFNACAGGFRSKRMTVGQIVFSPSDLRSTYKAVRLPL